MIDNIKLTTENYKFNYVKNKYEIYKGCSVEYVNEIFYDNATCEDTIQFFKRLGSKQYTKKADTKFGRKVVKNISTSPSGELKTVRYFDFSNAVEV